MDPISDMLIRIKNAYSAGHESVLIPYSNVKFNIANLLQEEGFVGAVSKKGKKTKKTIGIDIKYEGKIPRISGVSRVSKPSRRIYISVKNIRPVLQGRGALILSTPKGIMTDKSAKKEHVGGEAMFKIW